MGRMIPPDRAPFDGMIMASSMSEIDNAYDTPNELVPNSRTKNSAMRRARPVLISAREMKNAACTSHTVESPYPASALAGLTPPSTMLSVTAISTNAPPGSDCRIEPAIVAMNMPVSRQPSALTAAGFGMR